MQRYKYKYQVKIGDRIMFDNTSGYTKELIVAKFVGEVSGLGADDSDDIEVIFQTEDGPKTIELPFYLAQ